MMRLIIAMVVAAADGLHAPVASPVRGRVRVFGGDGEAATLRSEIERLELRKKVATLRAEIAIDEAAYTVEAAAESERRSARDAVEASARTARNEKKVTARERLKRDAVLRQCLDANATEVSLILLNDATTKRARVLEVLTKDVGLEEKKAEEVMLRAHRSGAGVVDTWKREDLEAAWSSYAKLADAGLEARFEAVDGADAEDLERIAELRDLGAKLREYNVDILNEKQDDLNFPTTVALNAVVAVVACACFSLAWQVGGDLGAFAGESLGGAGPTINGLF